MTGPLRVGVIGAGLSGLATVHALRLRGLEVVCFERRDRPGGVIRTLRPDGRVLDVGPQRTRLTPSVRELIEAVGLAGDLIEAADGPLYVQSDGALRRLPTSIRAAVETDALSWRGKVRALLEPMTKPPRPGETVLAYFERAFGPEVARIIAGPLFSGLYAGDPAAMPVEHTLVPVLERFGDPRSLLFAFLAADLRWRDPPPVVSFEAGMGALPAGLLAAHDDVVCLGRAVEGIDPIGDGYRLQTAGGGESVDHVVLATPASAAGGLLEPVAPAAAARLRALRYNPLAVVHLAATPPMEGAGYQVALDEGFLTRGVTWNGRLLGRNEVNTAFLGGATSPDVLERSDFELAEIAVEEFESAVGVGAEAIAVHRLPDAMPAFDDSWHGLDGPPLPDGIHLCANYVDRPGIPGRISQAQRVAERVTSGTSPAA